MVISASVASTAGPARPEPSSSEIRITPVPVAMPLARPNTPPPAARPAGPRTISCFLRILRSGTEAMITRPSTMPSARASRML